MRALQTKAFILAMLLVPGLALAQTGHLDGTVIDAATGEPLPGANVFLEELGTGGAADPDGRYTITDVPVGTYTLRVSFIGFKTDEQAYTVVDGVNTLDVGLAPDLTGLEEIVVTGIASSTSKARAEVAVSRLDATAYLDHNAYQDLSQLMSGKVSGVSVQPATGNVAGGIRFNMRSQTGLNGDGQPIIYVDGVRIDNDEFIAGEAGHYLTVGGQGLSMLSNLNPEDIESIDVLKGPAGAALYGTSGSNGVVRITTKRGKLAGGGLAPFNVTYKGVLGANQQARKYDAYNAATPDVANSFFRDGTIAGHTLGISGGSERMRYFTSFDKRFEQGHVRNSDQDRQSFRANFEAFPGQKVTVRANTAYSINDIHQPSNDNNIYGFLFNTLITPRPYRNADSVAIVSLKTASRVSRYLGSVEAEYAPVRQLTIRASVGFDGTDLRTDQTFPSNLSYRTVTSGRRTIVNRRNEQYTYDINARYTYNVTPSLAAASIVGTQAFNRILRTSSIAKEHFETELITNVGAGADFLSANETFLHTREAGLFAQQELAWQDRLFLTLGLRRDFASTVGAEAPTIWYPKASVAVRLEQFPGLLPRQINFLKLRAAYGETGQLPELLDKSSLRWRAEPSGYGTGAVPDFVGNPEIEPERIRELEVGLEAELFTHVGLDLTYYRQWAENSIIDFHHAPSTGLVVSAVPFNVGKSKGWGLETSLSAAPIRSRDYGVDVTFIWNYQANEVQDLGGSPLIFGTSNTNVIREGLPRDAFWAIRPTASFHDDGTYAGAVLSACEIDGAPVDCSVEGSMPTHEFAGTPYPRHNGSLSVNLRFLKNFTLNALADWALDQRLLNLTGWFQTLFRGNRRLNEALVQIGLADPADVGLEGENLPVFEPGTPAYRAAAEVVATSQTSVQGHTTAFAFLEKSDFFKIREISLRYDFTDLLRKAQADRYVRRLSFALSARNVWTRTPYSGSDPEVNWTGARSSSRAVEFLTLPSPRVLYGTLTIGL